MRLLVLWWLLTVPVAAAQVEFSGEIPDETLLNLLVICRYHRPCIDGTPSEKIERLRQTLAPQSTLTVHWDDPALDVRRDKDGVPCGSGC